MDRAKMDKYRKIYREKVLPKKTVTRNTTEIFNADLQLIQDFSIYRERANRVVIGGDQIGEETTN